MESFNQFELCLFKNFTQMNIENFNLFFDIILSIFPPIPTSNPEVPVYSYPLMLICSYLAFQYFKKSRP